MGNGLGVRLPKSILDQVNFQIDDDIEIIIENGRIILAPIEILKEKPKDRLSDFLSILTPKNGEDELNFDRPIEKRYGEYHIFQKGIRGTKKKNVSK